MRSTHALRRASAIGACLALTAGVTACTDAADWKPAGASGSDRTAGPEGYDTSAIQKQPEIAAMLPELSDSILDIGAATDYAPAEFLSSAGSPIGYDVDLTKAVAAVLGVQTTTHTAEFDSIIASIGSKYDAGVSSFTITTEREAAVDMIAYVNVGSRFNVATGNPAGINPADHLNLCGHTVGVQTGTAQEETMNADAQRCGAAGRKELTVRSYSKQSEAATALIGGTIDAIYSDSTVAGYAVALTNGELETIGEVEDALPQGIVISKDDPEMTKAVQAAVQYLMDQGVWEDILSAWGVKDAALSTAVVNPNVEK